MHATELSLYIPHIVPVAVITEASDVAVIENNDATFTCVFEADPTPFEYMWQFTDSTGTTMELSDGDKHVIQSSSEDSNFTTILTITSTEYADHGTYNCSASNMINDLAYTSSDVATLTIHGRYML